MERKTRSIPMDNLFELVLLQLENGGRARLRVTGCSMEPMLRNLRDSVELIPVSGKLNKGQIALYRRANGQYVLHRIITVTEDGYICCGDNQAMREPVSHDQLLAVVDGFVRKGKKYTLNAWGYRLYTALFVGLFPLRRYYIAIKRRFARLRNKLFRKNR